QVFFTEPEAASVGLSANDAEQAGHRVRVVDVEIGEVVKGAVLYADGYTGRARMVVDEDHGYLLGVTMVGPGVEGLIHSATIAVAAQVPVSRLWHAGPTPGPPPPPLPGGSGPACLSPPAAAPPRHGDQAAGGGDGAGRRAMPY